MVALLDKIKTFGQRKYTFFSIFTYIGQRKYIWTTFYIRQRKYTFFKRRQQSTLVAVNVNVKPTFCHIYNSVELADVLPCTLVFTAPVLAVRHPIVRVKRTVSSGLDEDRFGLHWSLSQWDVSMYAW